jgi:hypothetical protein
MNHNTSRAKKLLFFYLSQNIYLLAIDDSSIVTVYRPKQEAISADVY